MTTRNATVTPYSWAIQTMTSSTIEAPSSASEERAVVQPHLIDQLDRRLVTVLKVIGFGLPIVTYFWVVFHFGVNVIYGDQLSDISVVSASQHHFLPWEALWAQYQDNRLLFPNLIVLLLARTVALNIHTEELVSATFLLAATALVIGAHKKRAPTTPWLYYCPVALLTFSLVQYQDTLFGYQLAWYLILLSLAAALFLLDVQIMAWAAFGGAVAAAVVGSLSSFQGLLIWPVGLVLLYHRRRHLKYVALWIGTALVTCFV